MTLDLKDIVFICAYLVSIICLLSAFRYRIKKVEETHSSLKNIIFLDKGGLNIVTNEACKERRNIVIGMIRRESGVTRKAFEHIDCLNQNMIRLMMHMNLTPVKTGHQKGITGDEKTD